MNAEKQKIFHDALKKMSENNFEVALGLLSSLNPLGDPINPRLRSYYGLCLAKAQAKLFEGIRVCQEALALERRDPDIYYNLAQLYLLSGKQKSAINLLYRGLPHEQKQNKSYKIVNLIEELVRRRHPFIPWLSRKNPINKYMGKFTYARAKRIQRDETRRIERRAEFADYLFFAIF